MMYMYVLQDNMIICMSHLVRLDVTEIGHLLLDHIINRQRASTHNLQRSNNSITREREGGEGRWTHEVRRESEGPQLSYTVLRWLGLLLPGAVRL